MTTRTILHLDLDAFFCMVEIQHNPALRGKAFAVGGRPNQRGVVASCSYEARIYGVHSAMPMGEAQRRCPDLLIVPAKHGRYGEVSERVMAILHDLTPLVQPLSIDEAFLDVTGLAGSSAEIARDLQTRIRQQMGLPASLGVATNKLLAKIANNIGKSRPFEGETPCAIEVVPPGQEAAYLAPLDVTELWGVGTKTAERLHAMRIYTIGDIARKPQQVMIDHFGKHGHDLWQRANGIDHRPVTTERERKSVSKETTFARDVRDGDTLRQTLRHLSEQVGLRLRQKGLHGTTVKLKLRWSDFTTITRQTSLHRPTNDDRDIIDAALALLAMHWTGEPVRLLGVGVSNFNDAARQLDLWEDEGARRERQLQHTLDDLRERFGGQAIRRGSDI